MTTTTEYPTKAPATFECAVCGNERPYSRRCPIPNAPSKFRCVECLNDLHLRLYRELDAMEKGVARRARFVAPVPEKRGVAADPNATIVVQLTRTFRGETLTVDVLAGGWYRWRGMTFPNPTSCAEKICGYKVSGPAFFAKAERISA